MSAIIIISLIVIILYVYKILRWRNDWENINEFHPANKPELGVSVIVPFRNERENLESLLRSLKKQDYRNECTEVILVDDHSDDGSYELACHLCESSSNFRCIQAAGDRPGKKSALKTGITMASNELVVTTDADANIPSSWLSTIAGYYAEKGPSLILGLVDIEPGSGFFNRFTEAEFISLIAAGAGAAAGRRPIYCNGANLAFRRSLYFELADAMKERVVSGDDTFLLHAAIKKGLKIDILKSLDSTVTVKGPGTVKKFYSQHLRWVSKSRYYRNVEIIIAALLVMLTNALLVASFIMMATGNNYWLFAVMILLKGAADYQLLHSFYTFFRKKLHPAGYIAFSVIYPFYVLTAGTLGHVAGFSWKGRSY